MDMKLRHLLLEWARYSLCDADDAASYASSGIARLETLLITSLAKVIFLFMHHQAPADDGVGPNQGDLYVRDVHLADTVITGHNVPKVTSVSVLISGSTMCFSLRVEMGTG